MMTLSAAQAILATALSHARAKGLLPLAAVVLDAGGHPVASAREDGASFFRHEIAHAKAYGALGMGSDSRALADRAKNNPLFFQTAAITVGGQMAFSPGGVLVRDAAGGVIGAVGVSGDTGDMDEECALTGIAAAGLTGGAA